MRIPGESCGPMGLPASYTKQQLAEYRWSEEKQKFLRPPTGPWKSRLHKEAWGNQSPRYTRKPSHYWGTRNDARRLH